MTTKPLTHLLDTYILPRNMRIIFHGNIYFFIKNLTEGHYFRNEKLEAIDMYSKIHKSSNYYQEAQYYLGEECYLNQEEFTEAVEVYNKR